MCWVISTANCHEGNAPLETAAAVLEGAGAEEELDPAAG